MSSLAAILLSTTAACSMASPLPDEADFGPHPTLPEPDHSPIPTVNSAPAITRWAIILHHWVTDQLFPKHYWSGAFIGQHGSWNRSVKSGYKVIFVPFVNGKPAGMPEDILTGFLDYKNNALGRPVGVVVANDGALLVADDVGNAIWRVTPTK